MRKCVLKLARLLVVFSLANVLCLGVAGTALAAEENTSNENTTTADATNTNIDGIQDDQSDQSTQWKTEGIDLGEDNVVNAQQLPDSSFIYDASISDLSTADVYVDGQTVQVVGEVVGDCIRVETDSDHSWIVLADDDATTVSVYMDTDDTSLIDTYGSYGHVGTRLQVRGTFNLACADHQGQTDIHAEYVSVIKKGEATSETPHLEDFLPGVILVAVGFLLFLLFNLMRERRK